jgi:hypothetical protein
MAVPVPLSRFTSPVSMNDVTLIKNEAGRVECRVCGLIFVPDSEEDREQHEDMHRRIICGGVPLSVREFLKDFGWAVAHNDGGVERLKDKYEPEIGKRAVVFAYWIRGLSKGIPENDCDKFMAAHFAFVDAMVSGDKQELDKTSQGIKPWEKYAG